MGVSTIAVAIAPAAPRATKARWWLAVGMAIGAERNDAAGDGTELANVAPDMTTAASGGSGPLVR